MISFHGGHSGEFCDHASSCSLEDVIKGYIEKGFKYIGISEHQARSDNFLYPEEIELGKTSLDLNKSFDLYFKTLRNLREKYKNKISILVGFETETCDGIEKIKELRDKYQPDYLVGSLHHVNSIPIDYSPEEYKRALNKCGSIEDLFISYYDSQLELIKEIKPEVIGHFDLIRIFAGDYEPSSRVMEAIRRNIEAGVSYGALFEVNSRAYKKGFLQPYPQKSILNMLADLGASATLGDDSHGPEDIGLYYSETVAVLKDYFKDVIALKKDEAGLITKVRIPLDDVLK